MRSKLKQVSGIDVLTLHTISVLPKLINLFFIAFEKKLRELTFTVFKFINFHGSRISKTFVEKTFAR